MHHPAVGIFHSPMLSPLPTLPDEKLPLGAHYLGNGKCSFNVWAPFCAEVSVVVQSDRPSEIHLRRAEDGYFSGVADGIEPGTRYFFRLEDKLRPDPASRFQPETVHGPSEIVDPHFDWTDHDWSGLGLRDFVLYEMHVGTATRTGTFEGVISMLPKLKDLGVTAIELMPVAQFPGARNWGYDGVYPFAVQNSYGGPHGLKRLVNAAHRHGLAVILDVVYNHFGPEGNYLRDFGPYFTDVYKTPWGQAINFDGRDSDHVRRFFLENALRWQAEFHIDGLRLDAIHAIRDFSATPFLQELARAVRTKSAELGRTFHLFAESDLNDARFIRPESEGGIGLDAQWSDDFHHCLHVLLTGERDNYYRDFGGVRQLANIYAKGYAYTGQYSPYRRRKHGNLPTGTEPAQFVVYSHNHDQIGNRVLGERLSGLVDFEELKLAAAAVILSPFTPMLFMGEEYGETAPFQYFVDHADQALVEAIHTGRREEFGFMPEHPMPNCSSVETFNQCMLRDEPLQWAERNGALRNFYREVLQLRKTIPAISQAPAGSVRVQAFESQNAIAIHYGDGPDPACLVLNFSTEKHSLSVDLAAGKWELRLDSKDRRWSGPGSGLESVTASEGRCLIEAQAASAVLYVCARKPAAALR